MDDNLFIVRGHACVKTLDKGLKNKFKWEWLQEKVAPEFGGGYYSDCFRKLKEAGAVYCVFCEDKIKYGSSGKKALSDHVKRPAHMTKMKEKKSERATQPALASIFKKLKCLEEGKSEPPQQVLPYGTPENVLTAAQCSSQSQTPQQSMPRLISMADRKSHQEGLICSFIAEHSLPLSLAPHLVSLAQEQSRDHKALQELKLGRTPATCKLKEGVSGVLRKRLVSTMKQTPFSVNIDESTLKSNKKRVLNILVCYFSEELGRSVTHLYASVEMTVVNADTVYSAVINKFKDDDICLTNIVSVLSDSAAYMRGSKNGFQAKLKESVPEILDIDGDVCHHLHNIVKTFMTHLDPENYTAKLLGDIHRDFSLSADLRDDICQISSLLEKPPLLPIEFAGHRWMSLMDATSRLLDILDQITLFYFAWAPQNKKEKYSKIVTEIMKKLPAWKRYLIFSILRKLKAKNLTMFGKARKSRIVCKVFESRSKMLFLCKAVKFLTPLFKNCILALEKGTPQVHKLYDKILEAFTQFLACYVKPEVLNAPRSSVKSIDLENKDHYLPSKQMTVGSESSSLLKDMPDSDRKSMLEKVNKAFVCTGIYMKSKLPLENKLIIALSSLDPIVRRHSTTKAMMKELNKLIHLPETDDFLRQLNSYHIDNELPDVEASFKLELDEFWNTVIKKYPAMTDMVKKCLSLFTGPKVEQSFSLLNNVLDSTSNRMAISTAEAYQRVKYFLLAEKTTSVSHFYRDDIKFSPVDQSLCHHIQSARVRANKRAAEVKKTTHSESALARADAERHAILGIVGATSKKRPAADGTHKPAKRIKKSL